MHRQWTKQIGEGQSNFQFYFQTLGYHKGTAFQRLLLPFGIDTYRSDHGVGIVYSLKISLFLIELNFNLYKEKDV